VGYPYTHDVTNLESRLLNGELPEFFSDVENETSNVVLGEVRRAAVEGDEPIQQVILELPTTEIGQELKGRRKKYSIHEVQNSFKIENYKKITEIQSGRNPCQLGKLRNVKTTIRPYSHVTFLQTILR